MSTIKTQLNDASVEDFINGVSEPQKREDAFKLLEMFQRITKESAKMWGSSIIGFGSYHYKSARSRQEGDWPLTGFSPRKQSLTLYIMEGFAAHEDLLSKLGKYKTSKSCLYINKLSDVDLNILEEMIAQSYSIMKKSY